ncbi:hypothetical protein AAMO2058_001655500 [Amorphochlora amoebiformis]|mmetsp:Transcript_16340/g.25884  ORF Transcript_16340/g.25884 Transcript_16340/m.25884 type:complete len:345 (-) Transcript_16340:116-1150(-)
MNGMLVFLFVSFVLSVSLRSSARYRLSGSRTRLRRNFKIGYKMSTSQIIDFERRGYAIIRDLFSPEEISHLSSHLTKEFNKELLKAYQHRCEVEIGSEIKGEKITSISRAKKLLKNYKADIPFLQLFNLWKTNPAARNISRSPKLCTAVADLLGVNKLCLYQDSLFVKFPGHSETSWHSDLGLAPLDTNHFLTVWIPMTPIKQGTTGLKYAKGSHRDFALGFWHKGGQNMDLSDRYEVEDFGQIDIGSACFHHGWCLHAAGGLKQKEEYRVALAISYFGGEGMTRVLPRRKRTRMDKEDARSYAAWVSKVRDGDELDGQLEDLPLVYESQSSPESGTYGTDILL